MATATLYGKDCSCDCDYRLKDKPCTNCCPRFINTASYYEAHGSDECPNVSPPCVPPGGPSPSCANLKIGPITLRSDPFPTECLEILRPEAAIGYFADNFGFASGQRGRVGCPPNNDCSVCGQMGSVIAFVDNVGGGKSRMRITAYAQNAPHGGPYSLAVTASFYLVP